MPRIVGGVAKGHRLKIPRRDVRPATARARKALFDYLAQVIPDARLLDLYCGSGGLGLEALSRGAESVCFVDISLKVINVVRDNARALGFWEQSSFEIREVFRYLHNRPPEAIGAFDIVMAAPPYRIAEPAQLLDAIDEAAVLAPGGIVCLEYSRHTPAPTASFFRQARRRVYGETVIEVWDSPNGEGEAGASNKGADAADGEA